jgi:hypothetical protein
MPEPNSHFIQMQEAYAHKYGYRNMVAITRYPDFAAYV